MADVMYELTAVTKVFGTRDVAVRAVSFSIGRGEHVAFIGPSGAGKTTLFRIMNLTLRPTEGTVAILGADAARRTGPGLRRLRRRIGTVYQQHNLVGWLRVVHNVLAGHLGRWSTAKALLSLGWPQDVASAAGALHRVGLADKLYARTDTLSGGQQQRVAIARVLVQDPDVILADEPVSSVDPSLAESLVRLLRDLSRAGDKTLLMNLHSVDLAVGFFPRVIGIRAGSVFFDLPPEKVNARLLGELYAGSAVGEDGQPVYERALSVAHGCRPLPARE